MSSAGHVLDMISRMKNNAALKKARHEKSKWKKTVPNKKGENQQTRISVPTHTQEEVRQAMDNVRQRVQLEKRRMNILYVMVILMIAFLVMVAYLFL